MRVGISFIGIDVLVKNQSERVITFMANDVTSLLLSARYLTSQRMAPLSGWVARSSLDFDIELKSSIKANIFLLLPPSPGEGHIEFTLLQADVVWLHGLGDKTALSKKI